MPENASVDGAEIRPSLLQIGESAPMAAAGKPQGYQLFFLALILIASQCELFVILAIPFAYLAIWAVVHAPVFETSDALKCLSIIGAEWLEVGAVSFVARGGGFRLFDFVGRAQSRNQFGLDVCLGIGLGVAEAVYTVLPPVLKSPSHVHFLTPFSGEFILLVGVSLSAGIVEEMIYRGYLQRLLIDRLDDVWLAIAIQAVVFALAHSYQGIGRVLTLTGQSMLTGYLAFRLGNLRLVIAAHCTLDLLAGAVGSL